MMKRSLLAVVMVVFLGVTGFTQQLNIKRIEQMPNLPQPLEMRDWKSVAFSFDSLVFSSEKVGTFLPLLSLFEKGVVRTNEPSFGMVTYVGSESPTRGEAINILPALIGASLNGVDKTNQFGHDWVAMSRDFFNPQQGIYVNNPGSKSGNDWWYDTMPNVFFYQLRSLYSSVPEFDLQFKNIADAWLEAVGEMGGRATPWNVPEMNYRAWNLETMKALDNGVAEPEAAGALAWILYNAYRETGVEKYRIGAEWCMEFLNQQELNPSYELQLPYGVYTAACMNAELGTRYDLEKMLNWTFDIGHIRDWGAITGTWDGNDVSGLIGESKNGISDYAFLMNGLEQFSALVPLVRYDDRFARAIGKWALNLSNATRLFYGAFHPSEREDNEDWLDQYDPQSSMGYEALKELKNGIECYATGDAMEGGWAPTNLALYGSSHIGILGGIITAVHQRAILQLDLLKTDYYGDSTYPTSLLYNPFETVQEVELKLPSGNWSIYDAIKNEVILTHVSGSAPISILSDEAVIVVVIPDDAIVLKEGSKSLVGDHIIDFRNGSETAYQCPRIKAFVATDTLVELNSESTIFCTVESSMTDTLTYGWLVDGELVANETGYRFTWKAGDTEGQNNIRCIISATQGWTDSVNLIITTINKISETPQIDQLNVAPRKIVPNGTIVLNAIATDPNHDELSYRWINWEGDTVGFTSNVMIVAPSTEGRYSISCKVTDTDGMTDEVSVDILVRNEAAQASCIAHYPFEGNANDISPSKNHGTTQAILYKGEPDAFRNEAAWLNNPQSLIRIPNNASDQGDSALCIAFAFRLDKIPEKESFIVSHGSWQERWKFSISEGKLRFTLKTTSKVVDVESAPLETGRWYEVVGQYSGTELELWIDHGLIAFQELDGIVGNTLSDISVGQMLPTNYNYPFSGYIDNLIFFSGILDQMEIIALHDTFNAKAEIKEKAQLSYYPNPASSQINLILPECESSDVSFSIFNLAGSCVYKQKIDRKENSFIYPIDISALNQGAYIIQVFTEQRIESINFFKCR